jgi:selenocysteine lyase/cysteine desulfurase
MDRRRFLGSTFLTGAALGLPNVGWTLTDEWQQLEWSAGSLHTDDPGSEDFWAMVRNQYTVSPNIINLNNGGVAPQPKPVQEAHNRYYQLANEGPSYYMWRILDQGRESLRQRLADLCGADKDEVAINRNSTEGLNTFIFGIDLKPGDEVVLCRYDYPNMINAWKQREKRDGIKLVWVTLDLPSENDEAMMKPYLDAVTRKTKVVHLTHMVNWNGQVFPVGKLSRILRTSRPDMHIISDSAHSFAQMEFSVSDLGCDYMATSLHKWLCAPFGSGLMWIKKERIPEIWALLSATEPDGGDIRKFESLGTRSFASEMAIGASIDFHQMIGTKRKSMRLHRLKNYWMEQASSLPGVNIYTPKSDAYSGALGVFGIEGKTPAEIEQTLFSKFGIHSVAIDYEAVKGVRITPNVYTQFSDLDRLLDGISFMTNS